MLAWSVFSPNAGKHRPEKLRIRALFTQCGCLKYTQFSTFGQVEINVNLIVTISIPAGENRSSGDFRVFVKPFPKNTNSGFCCSLFFWFFLFWFFVKLVVFWKRKLMEYNELPMESWPRRKNVISDRLLKDRP